MWNEQFENVLLLKIVFVMSLKADDSSWRGARGAGVMLLAGMLMLALGPGGVAPESASISVLTNLVSWLIVVDAMLLRALLSCRFW